MSSRRSSLKFAIRLASLLLLLALNTLSAWAQFTSAIDGTVTDPSGAVVPTATVTIKNVQTGVSQSMKTSDAGYFRFTALPPSVYSLTVTAADFKTVVQEKILVKVAEVRTVNIALELGAETTEVTVTTAPPPIQLSEASVTGVIGEDTLHDLPLVGRNFMSLVVLTPGVTGLPSAGNDIYNTNAPINLNAAGQRSESNNFLIDSTSVTSTPQGGQVNVTPNVDSVQEVRVQVNNYSAEYGRQSSAQVNVVTKQGTNDWHGTASWFHTDNALTSRTIFQPRVPVYRNNQVSLALGGPIQRDKTFVFGSINVLRAGTGLGRPVLVPTPEFVNFMQQTHPDNISTFLLTTYPSSVTAVRRFTTAGQYAGVNCATLASPSNPIASPAGSIPCNLPVVGEGDFITTTPRDGLQWGMRVDRMFNGGKDRLYGNVLKTQLDQGAKFPFPAFDTSADTNSWFVNLNETHTFSPSVLNEVAISYVRNYGLGGVSHGEVPLILVIGMEPINFTIGPIQFAQNNWHLRDTLSLIRGKHSLKLGGSYLYGQSNGDFVGLSARAGQFFLNPLFFAADSPFLQPNISFDPKTGEFKGLVHSARTCWVCLFRMTGRSGPTCLSIWDCVGRTSAILRPRAIA